MKDMPLIGITPGYISDNNRLFIGNGYVNGVNKAGGFAVLLPLTDEKLLLEQAISQCDGFLLSGGPDIDASTYGELNYNFNGEISPYRDKMDISIAKMAVEQGKPVLGICRGMQVLNIALGGTLYQDIHSQIKDRDLIKHSQEAPKWHPIHDISIEKNSRLWHIFNKDCISVNSFHHQAVKDVGSRLKVTAVSPDGIIEAVEHESHIFAVGVQCHPEIMWQENEEILKLFRAFVRAAAEN